MEMESRSIFGHLHAGRPETFQMTSTPDPRSRMSLHTDDSRTLEPGRGRNLEELDITPPSMEDDDFHSHSDEEDPKKYPDYCRTLKVKDANGTVRELVFPKALDLDRPKRARTQFSAEQLYQLEREFQRNQYLVGRERTELAQSLGLSETQVKVWFQNRRTKYKRDKSREQEERQQTAESRAKCNLLRMLHPQKPDQPVGGSNSIQTNLPTSTTTSVHIRAQSLPPPPAAVTTTHSPVNLITGVNHTPSSFPASFPHHPCAPTIMRPHLAAMGMPLPYHTPLPGYFNS